MRRARRASRGLAPRWPPLALGCRVGGRPGGGAARGPRLRPSRTSRAATVSLADAARPAGGGRLLGHLVRALRVPDPDPEPALRALPRPGRGGRRRGRRRAAARWSRPTPPSARIAYRVLLGDEELAQRYGALGFPSLYVIRADGTIDSAHVGLVDAGRARGGASRRRCRGPERRRAKVRPPEGRNGRRGRERADDRPAEDTGLRRPPELRARVRRRARSIYEVGDEQSVLYVIQAGQVELLARRRRRAAHASRATARATSSARWGVLASRPRSDARRRRLRRPRARARPRPPSRRCASSGPRSRCA